MGTAGRHLRHCRHRQRNFRRASGLPRLGILVGDVMLPNAGREKILETYYSVWQMTIDYQFIADPAYNCDRGLSSEYAYTHSFRDVRVARAIKINLARNVKPQTALHSGSPAAG